MSICCRRNSGAFKLGRVKRLKRIDITDGLRLLVPPEIAQRYAFRCEVRQKKAVFLDGRDRFLHVQVLRWLWADAAELGSPAAFAGAQGTRENRDNRIIGEVEMTASHHPAFADRVQITANH